MRRNIRPVNSNVAHKGHRLLLEDLEVELPDGTHEEWDAVRKNPHVGVVVYDIGLDAVAIVRQYRPVVDRVTYEIPGGGCEEGEDYRETVVRELREETGIIVDEDDLVDLPDVLTSAGYSDDLCHLFYVEVDDPETTDTDFDADESITLQWWAIDGIHEYLLDPDSCLDAKSAVGLLVSLLSYIP